MTVLAVTPAVRSEAQVRFRVGGREWDLTECQVVAQCAGDKLIDPPHYLVLARLPDGRWVELMVFGPGRVEAVEVSPTLAQWLIRHYEGRALVEQARAQARKKGVA